MEDTLVLVLGPPPEGWQKDLFYKYQNDRRTGEASGEGNWEAFEGEIVSNLFGHDGESPSTMDELFSQLLGAPVRIEDPYFSMSPQRGLWVANIAISRSHVHVPEGSEATWPPSKKARDDVGLALMYLLKREWVNTLALYPERHTG